MNFATLLDSNLGKRMMAFLGGSYFITEAATLEGQIQITIMAVVYMVCQTVSDGRKNIDVVN